MDPVALPFTWDGEAMVPPPAFARRADQAFVVGERYILAEVQERSPASHRQFFATVRDAWMSLPPALAERFPSDTILRKHCLIKAGFCDIHTTVCTFKTEARRLAAALAKEADDYVIVSVDERVVTSFRAKSQRVPAMSKEEFQASKEAVFRVLGELLNVEPADLARHGSAPSPTPMEAEAHG